MGRQWTRMWIAVAGVCLAATGCDKQAAQGTGPAEADESSREYRLFATPAEEATPARVSRDQPIGETAGAGARGELAEGESPASPPSAAEPKKSAPSRRERRAESMDQMGAMMGESQGENYGFGGLGMRGAGRGVGTIGRGAGGGYGKGAGTLGARRAVSLPMARVAPPVDREAYQHMPEATFINVDDQPLSTFSVDVDTASYSNVRRMLREHRLPPIDAVRVEEMLNYFDYDYGVPRGDGPFAIHTEVSDCPWNAENRLVHVGLSTQTIDDARTPARNLVFLLDVSGSMSSPDKLPLLKQGMAMLARNLRPRDRVSIAVYAGASGLALEPTAGDQTERILAALEQLRAGGSTAGADGIRLAYQVAQKQFVKGGINRVILATDGDFNVGISSQGELARLIEQKRKTGIFLTVLGFGRGNLQDARMETLADKGNGNYAYIDSVAEARKVLVREAGSTLVTVAKDVKLQVEFNPAHVKSYRLIGYENRTLAARDFNDDTKDAGEVGAGHSVTALYEVVPTGLAAAGGSVDPLRYQGERDLTAAADSGELMTLKVRYKHPDGARSRLIERPVRDAHRDLDSTSLDFRFAAAVAGFGLKLRQSPHVAALDTSTLRALAARALGDDPHGDRRGLLELIDLATELGFGG